MMSHTVRYFKLVYIVAGILLKNEHVCQTMDQIYIQPRYEKKIKPEARQFTIITSKSSRAERATLPKRSRRRWLRKVAYDLLSLRPIRRRLKPILGNFSIWSIPNYFLEHSMNFITNKLVINSDCDVIYNK